MTGIVLLSGLALSAGLFAAEKFKPFVLGSNEPGELATKVSAVKEALAGEGFEVVGEYSPFDETQIIVVTNAKLKRLASTQTGGAYAAPQRVSVVKKGNNVQVAYTNPLYFANAYRLNDDLKGVADALQAALGKKEEFGAEGMSARKLRKYHYTFGMEYFDEPMELAKYDSHQEAVSAIEKNLKDKKGGVSKVYRIDSAGGDVSVFGVHMTDGYSGDEKIMEVIDFKDLSQAAHLPYEMVVRDGKVEALNARFRIAIDFPDLRMVGDNSFMKITQSPDAIRSALIEAAGGEVVTSQPSGGFSDMF
jgi:hypothetical protein